MRAIRLSMLVAPLLAALAGAQVIKSDGPKPEFEVATVRPNVSDNTSASLGPRPGGRLIGTNQTVRSLIRNAFNLQPYQIVGGPGWIGSDRFDIVAKAADADLDSKGMMPSGQFMLRLQSLLEDRFHMAAHWETREMPVYALVASGGRRGPNLKTHTGDCDSARLGGTAPTVDCGTRTNMSPMSAKMTAVGISMPVFARNLSGAAGRSVIDKSGLAGTYDFELEFTPEQSPDTTGPSLFTAMEEQLGLKLESQRGPVEVLVIDRVETPTPD